MKAYKGFNQDMTCTPAKGVKFQYEEGKTYEEQKAVLCHRGIHACVDPLDVISYYPPGKSVYHVVELEDVDDKKKSDDSKICGKKITIGARVDISNLIQAAIDYRFAHTKTTKKTSATGYKGVASATGYKGVASAAGDWGVASATGDWGAASAAGDWGAASATGCKGVASATGYKGVASAAGDWGAASATGYKGAASATGYQGAASATGVRGAASATGVRGAASATGYQGAASATGDQGAASATGKDGVALAAGYQGKVKGAMGCAICCVERGNWNGKTYPIIAVKATIVDGLVIKPDTWYTLENGEFVEVEEE